MHLASQQQSELQQLYLAYQGELYGIAFFEHFIRHYQFDELNKTKSSVLQLLLQVEQLTAKLLKQDLEKLGMTCPDQEDQMCAKGITDADKWLQLSWSKLIDTMVPWVAPYQKQYHQQALAATSCQSLFTLVDAHETAIYDYLLAEQKGMPDAEIILRGFIERYRAD